MSEFITKKGHLVRQHPDGGVEIVRADWFEFSEESVDLQGWAAEAAAEFFAHKSDEERGWWRYPANTDEVVCRAPYHDDEDGRCVIVIDERTGGSEYCWESITVREAACAYFSEHPEPKPWHLAEPGEVWLVTCEGREDPYLVTDYGTFDSRGAEMTLNDEAIENARLIWSPEEDNDD